MKTRAKLAVGLALLVCAGAAQATLILNVNWAYNANGAYTGQGFISDPGNDAWNNMTTLSSNSLVYSDGSPATGVSLTATGNWNYQGPANTLGGGMLFSTGAMEFTISGLASFGEYQLAVMSIRPDTVPSKTEVTAGGTTLIAGPYAAPDLNIQNWVSFGSVTALGTGVLQFTAKHNSGDYWGQGYVNAFQLTAIPEPASLGMLGVAGIALLLRRKFRG